MSKENFQKRVNDIAQRAQQMRNLCIAPQFHPVTRQFIADEGARVAAIDAVAQDMPMFESLKDEHRIQIVSGMASSVAEYSNQFGEYPRDEVLATAHKTMENMLLLEGAKADGDQGQMMMESIGQSISKSSEGVEIRARMVGLILPTLLATATSDLVTYVPGATDEIEIFKIRRLTGSAFGDMPKGVEIDDATVGQYSQLRQRFLFPEAQQPDGSMTEHVFTSATDLVNTKIDIPFKKKSVSIFFNRKRVARDFGQNNGKLSGEVILEDGTSISLSGDIDYTKGIVTVKAFSALPADSELHIEFEVDIESKPELIPKIDHDMDSCKLRPYEVAIAADATIQTMFAMKREYGIDYQSMQMSHMRNYLANEKAMKHLLDVTFACKYSTSFNLYCPAGEDWKLHRELLREKLLTISKEILKHTKRVGLSGLFAGYQACTALKALGTEFFTPPEGYVQTGNIHYAGLLFGMYRVYEVPMELPDLGPWDVLCYGRGQSHAEAGYVASDAIPPTMYNHPIGSQLRSSETLWGLSYGEVHPFDGEEYFYKLTLENTPPAP